MKVLNIHERTIPQPKEAIIPLFHTLSSKEDLLWPKEKWPAMKLDKGLEAGSKGGHGPIRYFIKAYQPMSFVEFEFTRPKGFIGTHKLEVIPLDNQKSMIKHTIDMKVRGKSILQWHLEIRSLHDALIEDAFDKLENRFRDDKVKTPWTPWVRFLRWLLK